MSSDKGYKYSDKSTTTEGILKMTLFGGDAGKGKAVIIGKNTTSTLPTGIASSLLNASHATVQVLTSNAECFGATLTQVKKADRSVFNAVGP